MGQSYQKFVKVALSDVIPFIGQKKRLKVGDYDINVHSIRLQTFKRSLTCVSCGLIGTHFWAEQGKNDKSIRPHLNLYSINPNGNEILMTRDHIIPRSRGGSDSLSNMQTMCTNCNHRKGNRLDSEVADGTFKKQYDTSPKRRISIMRKQVFGKLTTGDKVCKVSRKLFKNGKRIDTIVGITTIFKGGMDREFALLSNNPPITMHSIHKNEKELVLMSKRDLI